MRTKTRAASLYSTIGPSACSGSCFAHTSILSPSVALRAEKRRKSSGSTST
jgi:hypothetical protein